MKKSKLTILYPKHNLQKQKDISIFFISFVLLVVSFSTILIASDQSKTSANLIEKGVTSLGKKIFQRNKASTDNVEVKLKPRASAAHPQAPKTRPKPKPASTTAKSTAPKATTAKKTTKKGKTTVSRPVDDVVRISDNTSSRAITRQQVKNHTIDLSGKLTQRDGDIIKASRAFQQSDLEKFYAKYPGYSRGKGSIRVASIEREFDATLKASRYKTKGCAPSCKPKLEVTLKPKKSGTTASGKAEIETGSGKVNKIVITDKDLVGKTKKGITVTADDMAKKPRTHLVTDKDGVIREINVGPKGEVYIDGVIVGTGGPAMQKKLIEKITGSSSGKPPANINKKATRSNPQKQLNSGDKRKELTAGNNSVDDAANSTKNWKTRKKALLAIATTASALYLVDKATETNNTTEAKDLTEHTNTLAGVEKTKKEEADLIKKAKIDAKKNPSTRLPSHVYAKEVNTVVFNNSELTGTPSPKKSKKDKDIKENGNIVVITYADRERQEADGTFNGRIGNVKVKVKRTSGENDCSNRKKSEGKTNNVRYKKDGKTLIKGTINYRTCNTGKYKVELVGKDGYTAVGKTSEECKIEDDQTCVVKFVLKKNGDPDPVVDTNGTVDQNNKDEGITQEL